MTQDCMVTARPAGHMDCHTASACHEASSSTVRLHLATLRRVTGAVAWLAGEHMVTGCLRASRRPGMEDMATAPASGRAATWRKTS